MVYTARHGNIILMINSLIICYIWKITVYLINLLPLCIGPVQVTTQHADENYGLHILLKTQTEEYTNMNKILGFKVMDHVIRYKSNQGHDNII